MDSIETDRPAKAGKADKVGKRKYRKKKSPSKSSRRQSMKSKAYIPPNGSLTMIYGPMYAGKTNELLSRLGEHEGLKHRILMINSLKDDREASGEASSSGVFTSHQKYPRRLAGSNLSIKLKTLSDLDTTILKNIDVVGIDEAQFFEDILTVVDWIHDHNVTVYTAGLLSTSELTLFGNYYKLLPHAEDVVQLRACCDKCIATLCKHGISGYLPRASFTKCLIQKDTETMVGSSAYIAVCRHHYIES